MFNDFSDNLLQPPTRQAPWFIVSVVSRSDQRRVEQFYDFCLCPPLVRGEWAYHFMSGEKAPTFSGRIDNNIRLLGSERRLLAKTTDPFSTTRTHDSFVRFDENRVCGLTKKILNHNGSIPMTAVLTPTARAAAEWRRSRNGVDVAVAVIVRRSDSARRH